MSNVSTIEQPGISRDTIDNLLGYSGKISGKDYRIRCPLHEDNTPSCSISFELQTFHCFGCGEKGTLRQLLFKILARRDSEEAYSSIAVVDKHVPKPKTNISEELLDLFRKLNSARADDIEECGSRWHASKCSGCDTHASLPWYCHDKLCTTCRSKLIDKWWEEHIQTAHWQAPTILCLQMPQEPHTDSTSLRTRIKQGKRWLSHLRYRGKLTQGSWWYTTVIKRGQCKITWWLFCDADLDRSLSLLKLWGNEGGQCDLQPCRIHQPISQLLTYAHHTLYSPIEVSNHLNLSDWLDAIKGGKLIQSFGDIYNPIKPPKATGHKHDRTICPCCGDKLHKGRIRVPSDEVIPYGDGFIWVPKRIRAGES